MNCQAVVMGGSAGGLEALERILPELTPAFAAPLLVVQHLHVSDNGLFAEHLTHIAPLPVVEPWDKTSLAPGRIYVAPANYHMLVERDGYISLSVDPRVNWSRPSIDVLFESAARVWGAGLVAVLLSGANTDGVRGLAAVRAVGGHTIAQDPAGAYTPVMPRAAVQAGVVDEVLTPQAIGRRLRQLAGTRIEAVGT
jgi:two-component system chemotaxis response regulator CheB